MCRCKAREILRNEAYLKVRRADPAEARQVYGERNTADVGFPTDFKGPLDTDMYIGGTMPGQKRKVGRTENLTVP